jgi:D-glycero-D-manno-heptose 1,7-bisphosphate phosphatase
MPLPSHNGPARPALFLDRDGVINVDRNYVYRVEDFEWVEGAAEAIRKFNERNWWVFVVTNQSGIARGLYEEAQMEALHAWLHAELGKQGARIDRIYHCPFHEEGTIESYRKDSFDRKPKPGMLIRAMTDFPVIKERSFLIGDKQADLEAAKAAGIRGFLFDGTNLARFAEWALADMGEMR